MQSEKREGIISGRLQFKYPFYIFFVKQDTKKTNWVLKTLDQVSKSMQQFILNQDFLCITFIAYF